MRSWRNLSSKGWGWWCLSVAKHCFSCCCREFLLSANSLEKQCQNLRHKSKEDLCPIKKAGWHGCRHATEGPRLSHCTDPGTVTAEQEETGSSTPFPVCQQRETTEASRISTRCLHRGFWAADRGVVDVYTQHFKFVPVAHHDINIFPIACRHIKITCGTAATLNYCHVVNINN